MSTLIKNRLSLRYFKVNWHSADVTVQTNWVGDASYSDSTEGLYSEMQLIIQKILYDLSYIVEDNVYDH